MKDLRHHPGPSLHTDPLLPVSIRTGRLLFALSAILLAIMPWTEALWTGDRFLRGGQDAELGLLAVLTFLCLILVLSQHVQQTVRHLLSLRFLEKLASLRSAEIAAPPRYRLSLPPRALALPLQI